jgi:hypothetical protein
MIHPLIHRLLKGVPQIKNCTHAAVTSVSIPWRFGIKNKYCDCFPVCDPKIGCVDGARVKLY